MISFFSVFALASPVLAQTPQGGGSPGGLFGNPMIFMVLMFVLMYFILIRPQRQRQKQHEELIRNVKAGDHVVTSGGVHGIIASLKDKTVMVRIADNVRVELDRAAIASITKKSEKPEGEGNGNGGEKA